MTRIRIADGSGNQVVAIDVDDRTGITIDVGRRLGLPEVEDLLGFPRRSKERQTRKWSDMRERSRRVTTEMEAAGVRAFLAGADTAKLGRSLASVFEAMEAADVRDDNELL